tara:strand:+ start:2147 stop:2470 length:324 start_codon:yes stop_codon:yes gene_type:complete
MLRSGRFTVCNSEDLENGSAICVRAGGHLIALFRAGEQIFALDDTCSHAQASLSEGDIDINCMTVSCPLHGAIFDLGSGEALSSPATSPVKSYAAEETGTEIVVTIP